MTDVLPNIKRIVLLMLENRSLDNVLGWLYSDQQNRATHNIPPPTNGQSPTYDGLVAGKYKLPISYGGETMHLDIVKGTCGNGLAVPSLDPWEEYEHVTNQLFGDATPYPQPTPTTGSPPDMQGFLQDFTTSYLAIGGFSDEIHKALAKLGEPGERIWKALQDLPPDIKNLSIQTWHQTLQTLQTFTPEQLPVLNSLAREYAVSDRWFSSVPSQTNPNRAFFHCGTSLGREKNSNLHADEHFPTDTLWNVLNHYTKDSDPNFTWGIYFQEDFPPKSGKCYTGYTFTHIYNIDGASDCFHPLKNFLEQAKNGQLPDFSFIEPKWGFGANKEYPDNWGPLPYQQGNDYHPPTSVYDGEVFVKQIYDALTSHAESWQETLFIITFDEHGGTWDHVPPPCHAKPPDEHIGENNFKFDRFGVRVPTILISPYIEAGTVFRSSTNVPYDHTSIIATILKWKGIDPKAPNPETKLATPWLGHRVENAPTFEEVLTRTSPRTGLPMIKPPVPEKQVPLTIINNTPAQIYVYLGWGPDCGPTKAHKLPTTIWGNVPQGLSFPGSVESGQSVTYDTNSKTGGKLFDYWVQASFYVGPDNNTPPDLIDGVLNKNWRLFWKGWRLICHHDTLTISMAKPEAHFQGSDSKGRIELVNNSLYPIYYNIVRTGAKLPKKSGTLPPGKSVTCSTKDWINSQYYIGLKYWSKGFIRGVTETWVNFWADWKPVNRNATVTITQTPPTISSCCRKGN